MSIYRNRRGCLMQTGRGGTYPVNNGDPQNDVELDDEDIEALNGQDDFDWEDMYK